LTKEEYLERVHDAAATLLTEIEAAAWKEENPDEEFWELDQEKDLYDHLHSIIDCTCESDWKGAIEVLQLTSQDADNVDSGIYEGCNWKRILVILAFEVYSWDTREEAQRMYENDEFEEYMMAIESNTRQVGHFPELQGYKIPKGPWIVNMHDAIKVLVASRFAGNKEAELSVVFEGASEGAVESRPSNYIVQAKRVYTQGGKDATIEADLQRCKEEFGVRLFPESGDSE
jgi:hypothetical protein